MRAAGSPDVMIHGPKGCMDMYEATKSFIVMHEFNVIGHDEGDGVYEDNAVTVRHVDLTSAGEALLPPEPKYTPWRHGELKTKHLISKFGGNLNGGRESSRAHVELRTNKKLKH